MQSEREAQNLGSMQLIAHNFLNLRPFNNVPSTQTAASFNRSLNSVCSAIWFLLSAIGATPLSLRNLALFADGYLRDVCMSFGFHESITKALYLCLVITSGSACIFMVGVGVFLAFSCLAGVCGLVSVIGGVIWGLSVGGAGGTAIMGVSVVAPTFFLSILSAAVIGVVGAVSKRNLNKNRLEMPSYISVNRNYAQKQMIQNAFFLDDKQQTPHSLSQDAPAAVNRSLSNVVAWPHRGTSASRSTDSSSCSRRPAQKTVAAAASAVFAAPTIPDSVRKRGREPAAMEVSKSGGGKAAGVSMTPLWTSLPPMVPKADDDDADGRAWANRSARMRSAEVPDERLPLSARSREALVVGRAVLL